MRNSNKDAFSSRFNFVQNLIELRVIDGLVRRSITLIELWFNHKSDMPYKLSAKPGEEVWNRRQFVPRASFKTKTTTKALIGLHNPYFWIWRPFLQPISIGPGIQSEEKKAQRRSFILPQCDLPGVPNTTPKPYTWSCCKFLTNIFPFLSLSLRMNLLWKEIWWEERYGLAYLSQLPCN